MTVQILPDFLTHDQVQLLLKEFDRQPYTVEKTKQLDDKTIIYNRHKNNHYNHPASIAHRLVYPNLEAVIGQHTMDHGSFLESHYPYTIHVDTHANFKNKDFFSHNENTLNLGILISLNEDPNFNTVFFDHFTEIYDVTNPPVVASKNTTSKYSLDDVNLSHLTAEEQAYAKDLEITDIYQWKIGHAVIWPRNQLHVSSNFYPTGKQKKALVLFV